VDVSHLWRTTFTSCSIAASFSLIWPAIKRMLCVYARVLRLQKQLSNRFIRHVIGSEPMRPASTWFPTFLINMEKHLTYNESQLGS
jgi:hypothetical protein